MDRGTVEATEKAGNQGNAVVKITIVMEMMYTSLSTLAFVDGPVPSIVHAQTPEHIFSV